MNTPIADFVRRYAASDAVRFHMPGHKGRPFLGCEPWDITEIAGADALYEAEGIIAESEKNAGALFGSRRTCYATEGASQCIRAMLYLAVTAGKSRTVVAARNIHRAFISAAALLALKRNCPHRKALERLPNAAAIKKSSQSHSSKSKPGRRRALTASISGGITR